MKSGLELLTSCLADGNLKYTIFIYKHDKFHAGLPVYHINRYVGETGAMFEDGSNIIYVNGTYSGDDDLGKMLADFMQPDASKINFKELADGVRYFKEEGGWENMCDYIIILIEISQGTVSQLTEL